MITTKDKVYIIKIIYMIVFLRALLTSIVLPIKEYISEKEFKAVKGVMNLSNLDLCQYLRHKKLNFLCSFSS